MLNRKQMGILKKWLVQRQADIDANFQNINPVLLDLSSRPTEQLDQASQEIAERINIRIQEREFKLRSKIELALDKIENGTFGICEECGEEISQGRLMARPVTTLCIHCKQDQEDEENHRTVW